MAHTALDNKFCKKTLADGFEKQHDSACSSKGLDYPQAGVEHTSHIQPTGEGNGGGKMYPVVALAHAIQLLGWLEDENNSSVLRAEDQTHILKLELRYLIKSLKHMVDGCNDYENLQGLLTRIEDVRQNIKKLHRLLDTLKKEESSCNSTLVIGHPSATDVDDGVRRVLEKIELVKPAITQVEMNIALANAEQLLYGLECEYNSSVLREKDQTHILKSELRFLIKSLKHMVDHCTDYENLQHVSTRIQELGQDINKLHVLILPTQERQHRFEYSQLLDEIAAVMGDPFPTDVDDGVRRVLEKIELVKPAITQVEMNIALANAELLLYGLKCEYDLSVLRSETHIYGLESELRILIKSLKHMVDHYTDYENLQHLSTSIQQLGQDINKLHILILATQQRQHGFEYSQLLDEIAAVIGDPPPTDVDDGVERVIELVTLEITQVELNIALANVEQLLHGLEFVYDSSVLREEDQPHILESELESLIKRLKHMVDHCTDHYNLQRLLTGIEELAQDITKLHMLILPTQERQHRFEYSQLLDEIAAVMGHTLPTDVDDGVRRVLEKIELVKPAITQVGMNIALAKAKQLLHGLECVHDSSVLREEDQIHILESELRFLIKSLEHMVDHYTPYENLQHLSTRIQELGQDINKLHMLILPIQERQQRFEYSQLLYVDDGVRRVLEKIELVKPEITQVLTNFLMNVGASKIMCHSSALANAIQLIDWLEDKNNLSVLWTVDQLIPTLTLELRFLITFLKYTAHRCTDYENLEHLLARIQDVGQHINKLHRVIVAISMDEEFEFMDFLLLDNIRAVRVSDVLDKIKLVKPEIRKVLKKVSRLSASRCRLSDEFLVEFIDSLENELNELLGHNAGLIRCSLKEPIKSLKRNLTSLKGLLSFTAKRCNDLDKLNQLSVHAQATADDAAYLAYSCLINEMDEDLASRFDLQLSHLVQRIDPIKPEVGEIFVGVLKASISSQLKSNNTYKPDETVVDYVDSLLENTSELQNDDMIPVKDQIEILHVKLSRLRYFLRDLKRFTEPAKSDNLLAEMEVMAIDAGCVIYSLFEDGLNQEIVKEMRLAVSKLLDQFELLEMQVRKICVKVRKTQISKTPRTDELGALDLLVKNLKELLNDRVDSIALYKDYIQIVQTDLEFLRSFLTTIRERRHEHEKLDHRWRQIIHVTYEVEYVIDLVVVKYGHLLHHILWLSDVIDEIKLIKTEINEIRISDKIICGICSHDPTEISCGPKLSQMNAPRIDGEMVCLKDEEYNLIEQLLCGSNQLQIVSIVGMPGLGKTFLTNKVYNNPTIRDHFHVRAWCNISQAHERKELLINILSQVAKFTEDMWDKTDEELAGGLKQSLLGQKYFIVLDDMWDIKAWNGLKRSFPNDKLGSRIVFTCRLSNLASQAGLDSKIHQLRAFSESESWELLQKKIFQKEGCPLELLEVGKQIARRCNGLPLTIVVVAGLLARTTKSQEQWREVAKNLSSYVITDLEGQCKDVLELSYKSLPNYLKSCFLYFGAFPEDKKILSARLKQLWIAEGFVRENEPDLENIAESYLMDLIDRNLIIAFKERSSGGVKACLVHDLVREFCLEKAKEEHFLKVIGGSSGNSPSSLTSYSTSYEQRRLFVHVRRDKKFLFESSGPCVRSLIFFDLFKSLFSPSSIELSDRAIASIVQGFKLLRVLNLIGFMLGRSFPIEIISLVQLRYLTIFGMYNDVPSSIANLWNLETFIVAGAFTFMSADTILNMTKLRHLHIHDLRLPKVSSSDNSSQLDSLQTLSTPTLSYGDDMKFMRRFPNLKKLRCWFKGSWDDSRKCNRLPVLDFLSKLESLKISYEGNLRHPLEFSLPSTIKKLTLLYFGLQWEHMSIVGKLPNLEVLKLLQSAVVGEEWNMQDGEFPKLRFLKLEKLEVKRWIASCDNFPPIEQLIVSECKGLEEIPSCLEDISTLKVIKIACCTDSLRIAVNQIQAEQIDLGNEDLKVEITKRP